MLTCTFEDGGTGSFRHATVDALVLDPTNTKILLVKRAPQLLEGGKWGNVGGYMERDETLVGCLKREVFEETGYEVTDAQLLTIRDNPDRPAEDRQNIAFVFFCHAGKQLGRPDHESTEIRWFAFSELPEPVHIAFDHAKNFELYQAYRREQFSLPVLDFAPAATHP